MTKNKTMKILLSFLFIVLFATSLLASGAIRNGSGGAQELLIPVGAQGIATANANIASLKGLESIYYNPAGLSASQHTTEVGFSYMNYIADINFVYAGVGVNLGNLGSVGFTIRSLDFGDIPETTTDSPYGTGNTFSPTFMTLGITYSNFLTDKIRAGVSFNLVTEQIMSVSATGLAVDAGIQYDNFGSVDGLKIGVVLRNFGPQMTYTGSNLLRKANETDARRGEQFYSLEAASFELPSQLEMGFSYEKNVSNDIVAVLSSSFLNNNFSNDEYKVGFEVGYKNSYFLRGGYIYTREAADGEDEQLFGSSLGAGVKIGQSIVFNYAYRLVEIFDNNQIFQITVMF